MDLQTLAEKRDRHRAAGERNEVQVGARPRSADLGDPAFPEEIAQDRGKGGEKEDAEHGAHCNNPDCVMYYLNEGASDLANFVITAVTSGSTIVFDEACLSDAHGAL